MSEHPRLIGKTIVIVGGTKNIGLRIAQRVDAAGARVVIAGRSVEEADAVASTLSHARGLRLDVADEHSIAAAAEELGIVEHIVVTAAAHHNAKVDELEHEKVVRAFEAKVIGPLMIAKHFAPRIAEGGSFVLFSGVAAWKPAPGYTVMGITDGAVSFAVSQLAKELAPIRVNAVSPGVIDSGAYDSMPTVDRLSLLDNAAENTLAGDVGRIDDVVDAVMWLLTAAFVSGETIHVDGGSRHS